MAGTAWDYRSWFTHFAHTAAQAVGHPLAFVLAVLAVLAWALTGPTFHYSDTWQLVINTGTTIVTFVMVFLIQQTQNRDSAAMQLKLDELIRAQQGAHNTLVNLEGQSEEEIQRLQVVYAELARHAREPDVQDQLAPTTHEAPREALDQVRARLVLFDDQGQVIWSAPMATRRGGPAH